MPRLLLAAALTVALVSGVASFSLSFTAFPPIRPLHGGQARCTQQRTAGTEWRWGRARARTAVARKGDLGGMGGSRALTMESTQKLITKPRTSHAWFGVYFDLEARDIPISVQSIETGCSSGAEGQKLQVQLWITKEGSFMGKEENAAAWECMGTEEMVLNTIVYDKRAYDASRAVYGKLPLPKPVLIAPAGRRVKSEGGLLTGFMIHTNSVGGLILRGGFGPEAQKNNWKIGEKSDETVHMKLLAGPVTASAPFTLEKDSPGWARAFAGAISYTIP